jgi:hypothetical protein
MSKNKCFKVNFSNLNRGTLDYAKKLHEFDFNSLIGSILCSLILKESN